MEDMIPKPRIATGAIGGVARLNKTLDRNGLGGRGRRSPLTRWLRAHHDDFATMLADREPRWPEVAAALASMGLLNGKGNPPTGECVRNAWWEVRRAKQQRADRRIAKRPVLAPGEIAPGVLSLRPDAQVADARPRPQLDIRPAMPLDRTRSDPALNPAIPISSAAGPLYPAHPPPLPPSSDAPNEAAQTGDLADAEIERVLAQMQAAKVPLPKIVR